MNHTERPSTGSHGPGGTGLSDAVPDNWVDTLAPSAIQPYLRLARADRPIGTWLLLLPCWWSLALAELSIAQSLPTLSSLLLFAIGAFVMRGAGCTWNDIVDREYDRKVARTANRPVASGQVSVLQAIVFASLLSVIGLIVLLTFNRFTIVLAISSLALVFVYPFMKRFTYWPQAVLGLAFNWGALVGWSSATGSLAPAPLLLYSGCIAWTIGYDTIYAHQDRDDDLMAGLKSTALKFGENTKPWLTAFYSLAIALWAVAASMAGASWITFAGLLAVALHFTWQVATLDVDQPANCLKRFRANREVGALVFIGLVADMIANAG